MAVCTRVGWPTSSRASCRASALITVASMPMVSAVARSIAPEAALHDLGDGLLGLALVAGQVLEHDALGVDHVGGDVVAAHPAGGGRGDVEGDVVADLDRLGVGRVDPGQVHEHADRAPLLLDV